MNDKINSPMMTAPSRNWPVPEEKLDEAGFGDVQIHNNVIAMIAHEAVTRVPGVIELSGTLVDELADIIGKRSRDRGVRVEKSENAYIVELTTVLEYGVYIPEVCAKLQVEVLKAVEAMTGKKVRAVNVMVQSIRRREKKPSEEV